MAQRLSREEFHRWAETQPGRYERIGGEPVAMSPERAIHNRIKARVWAALDRAVHDQGLDCEVFTDGMTVEIDDDTDYEPDAVVNCGPPIGPNVTVANRPTVVVEVLSPTTQSVDSTDKLADYFRVPSVQHYLVLRAVRREVVHHQRTDDGIITRIINLGTIHLDPPGTSIDITKIYAEAGFPL